MRAYEAILEYFPPERVMLGALVAPMRYAGPREAVLHALVRKNYGCTHFIVGRDHAGVGSYYGTFDAQQLISSLPSEDLGITPLRFDNAFFCRRCGGMATGKTCPHPAGDHLTLSGTQVRAKLAAGELPPPEFSRPEVAEILIAAYREQAR
jgi:sulfate adenylyltransferase